MFDTPTAERSRDSHALSLLTRFERWFDESDFEMTLTMIFLAAALASVVRPFVPALSNVLGFIGLLVFTVLSVNSFVEKPRRALDRRLDALEGHRGAGARNPAVRGRCR